MQVRVQDGVETVREGQTKTGRRRGWITGGLLALLLVFALEIVTTVRQESLTWDEGDHIFAGYMTWKTHDYGLNPEHPPMVKMLATIPLLGLPLRVPPNQHRYFKTEAYLDGRDMLFGNGPQYSAESLTFRVRMFAGVISLVLAALVFLAGWEMFGLGAGFLALTLLVFEPNVLAHSALVTTDAAASCFFLAAIYAFYRYCKTASPTRMVVAGVAVGLALAAKHSTVLLLPMLVLLAGCEIAFQLNGENRKKRTLEMLRALAGIAVVGLVVLWAFYGFRYNARPDGLRLDPSLAEYVLPLRPIEAKGILFLARFHVLPESYLYGLADVRAMANGMPSYFFGKVYAHGIWYYFPTVLAIKSTIGFLCLVGLAVFAIGRKRFRKWREILFSTVPAALYLLVAMTSHLNIGARHILPVWVFLCVFAAGGTWSLIGEEKANLRWGAAVGSLLAMHVVSSVVVYPNYMAYANELWGGPSKTYKYLTDSNTDWAQQLIAVKRYTDHKGIKDCWFGYFADPFIQPKDYGIPCKMLPTPDDFGGVNVPHPVPLEISGPVLISAGALNGFELGSSVLNPYQEFMKLEPSEMIQYGVLVFEGTFRVPLASSLSHAQQSAALLEQKQTEAAIAEAEQAVKIEPDAVQTQMALGDALKAAGRGVEARAAYQRALNVVQRMEPDARQQWADRINKRMPAV